VLYLLLVVVVIGWTGWQLYQAGKPFVRMMMAGEQHLADWINGMLLTGYYLVCMGYSFMVLSSLPDVLTLPDLMSVLCRWIGRLVLILAVLHYSNMLIFSLWKRYHSV